MSKIEDVILFQIERTSKISKLYSQREFDKLDFGITIEQWIVLKIIHENDNISQKDLAVKSLRDPASITRTLDILQKKNLINREAIPNNRRQYSIVLTPEGADFVKNNFHVIADHRRKSTEGFSENEMETFMRLLLKIQKNME